MFIKVRLAAQDDVPKLTQELLDFVTAAEVSGRTQLSPGKVGLSVVDPEQHRYELLAVGVAVAFAAFGMGVRSFAFTVFAVLGFPVWAYAGWFLMGCPAEDGKEKGYDISEPGEEGGRI